MRIIGLDVGEKRIGVARVDTKVKIAVPVGTVPADDDKWQKLTQFTRLYDTNFFVLGLPRSNEGNETKQSLYVRNFAKDLTEKIPGAKIRFQDESLTSVEAEKRLKSRKKSYQKEEIDAEAATIILQDFVEHYQEKPTEPPKNTNILKKSTDKAMLKSKKAAHRAKKLTTKLLIIPPAILIIALLAVGGVLWLKSYRAKLRAEEYAKQEAEMVAEVFNFTILPGETIPDIKQKLSKLGYTDDEIDTAISKTYDFKMFADKPANTSLEGYLLGETHEFYKDESVENIISTFLEGTQKLIDENNLVDKFSNQGLSLYEGITLASIIQKESKSSDMAQVAGIFYNRLSIGKHLGSDATIRYYIDLIDPERNIYQDNATILRVNSCYNTGEAFGNAGLPCGPISNPSLAALLAATEPSNTDYLYFLTGDDGEMYYSITEAGHRQNISQHCRNLCNVTL